MRRLIYGFLFIGMIKSMGVEAQSFRVDRTNDPAALMKERCLGAGVDVVDVTFEGVNRAVGAFRGGTDVFGIESGVVFTTGLAQSTPPLFGADGTVPRIAAVENNSPAIYERELPIINEQPAFDLAIYRITFVPQGDSISFRYVFASDEYPEFVCSDFNDVFVFNLLRTNGNGDTIAENLATVPGTDASVSINSINSGMWGTRPQVVPLFCFEPYGSLENTDLFRVNDTLPMVYNGFTKVLTAKAAVEACETYTMELVLADIGDAFWDSAIFFEAESFCSNVANRIIENEEDLVLTEGCPLQEVMVPLDLFEPDDYPLTYNVFGTAINGEDYGEIPSSGTIESTEAGLILPILPIVDELSEGVETIEIIVESTACLRDSFLISIEDGGVNFLMETLCPGDSIVVNGNTYNELLPFGLEALEGAAASGCDSLIFIQLDFYSSNEHTVLEEVISEGETLVFEGQSFSTSGEYQFGLSDQNGCDSMVLLSLRVQPVTSCITDTLSIGEEGSFCLNTSFLNSPVQSEVACNMGEGFVDFQLDEERFCLDFTGLKDGEASACVILCDDFVCDTTFFKISVVAVSGVWPGDVFPDGEVNPVDLAAHLVSLNPRRTGPIRPDATLEWIGQPASDWNETYEYVDFVDMKHADCNGDGSVDEADFEGVRRNWRRQHDGVNPRSSGFPNQSLPLSLIYAQRDGDGWHHLDLALGDRSNVVQDLFAYSFRIGYYPAEIESIVFEPENGWLANNGLIQKLEKDFPEEGIADFAFGRIGGEGVSGYGSIGKLKLKVRKDVNISSSLTLFENLIFQTEGRIHQLQTQRIDLSQLLKSESSLSISVYPNPVSNVVNIRAPEDLILLRLTLYNAAGQVLKEMTVQESIFSLSVTDLPSGLYFLHLEDAKEKVVKRIFIP